jgi:hypothetical protein
MRRAHPAAPCMLHVASCLCCMRQVSCRLLLHVAYLFCTVPVLHVACRQRHATCCCLLHVVCSLHYMVSVSHVACLLRHATWCRLVCCLWHPGRFAIIAAHWDSRCILHLPCCASHGVLTACLAHAAAAAPTDGGALAHADDAWVGTYPITVVPASPTTAPPTTVGKAAATPA